MSKRTAYRRMPRHSPSSAAGSFQRPSRSLSLPDCRLSLITPLLLALGLARSLGGKRRSLFLTSPIRRKGVLGDPWEQLPFAHHLGLNRHPQYGAPGSGGPARRWVEESESLYATLWL